jgi:hypothetical protein
MRLLLLAILALSTAILVAEPPPPYLKDGVITVTLKSGEQYHFSANEYMVVKRGAKRLDSEVVGTTQESHFEEELHNKNRVRLMAGAGPTGMRDARSASSIHIESSYGLVGGLGYDRQISNRFSLGAAGYTNGTLSLGVGYDF